MWSTVTSTTAAVGSSSGIVTGLAVSSTIPIITYTLPSGCFDTAIVRVTHCGKSNEGSTEPVIGSGVVTIRVIPNPNAGMFTISGQLGHTDDEVLRIEVTNMLGQSVYTGILTAHEGNLEAQVRLGNNITNGMYLLAVRSAAEVRVFHIVVEQ